MHLVPYMICNKHIVHLEVSWIFCIIYAGLIKYNIAYLSALTSGLIFRYYEIGSNNRTIAQQKTLFILKYVQNSKHYLNWFPQNCHHEGIGK